MAAYGSTLFSFMRELPFPTMYGENKTPAVVDVLETGWVVSFVLLALSLYILTFAKTDKVFYFVKVTLTLGLGLIIMACNFGYRWEVGHVESVTPYKAGSPTEVHSVIGIYFGMRGVNITMKATKPPEDDLQMEKIEYNEAFRWTWSQGRLGFGPSAGQIQQDFRRHQYRGTPLPIMWVAEYFIFDGEGIRFGRHYRLAGWYAHICLWAAVPFWILTILLMNMSLTYGFTSLSFTGAFLTTSALLWCSVRNPVELNIPFNPPERFLSTSYGLHWYLALITGSLCMAVGIVMLIVVNCTDYHDQISIWMGINPYAYIVEEYGEDPPGEDNEVMEPASAQEIPMITMGDNNTVVSDPESRNLGPRPPIPPPTVSMRFRSRGSRREAAWKIHAIPNTPPPQYSYNTLTPGADNSLEPLYEENIVDAGDLGMPSGNKDPYYANTEAPQQYGQAPQQYGQAPQQYGQASQQYNQASRQYDQVQQKYDDVGYEAQPGPSSYYSDTAGY